MSALIYALLAALPVALHLGLAAGAPWGRLTVGGRFPGTLPPLWRGLALAQAALLVAMATLVWQGVWLWPVLAVTLASMIANLFTPSRPERLFGGSVMVGMSLCLIVRIWGMSA